jgi:hypothetical protein
MPVDLIIDAPVQCRCGDRATLDDVRDVTERRGIQDRIDYVPAVRAEPRAAAHACEVLRKSVSA